MVKDFFQGRLKNADVDFDWNYKKTGAVFCPAGLIKIRQALPGQ